MTFLEFFINVLSLFLILCTILLFTLIYLVCKSGNEFKKLTEQEDYEQEDHE